MEILIADIPEEGLHLHFEAATESWFQQVLADALDESYREKDEGVAFFEFYRTGANVNCMGQVCCSAHPTCSRCLKVFEMTLEVPIHLNLAPLFDEEAPVKTSKKEEVELVKDDLDFAFYEEGKFNLGDLIHEQVILALPMQPVCNGDCKGLCQICGNDLNEGPCGCEVKQTDPRWNALKALKRP